MNDLPDEIFARILNLVPINQVIRCSIVSKRWDAACRYLIRTRESLIIGIEYSHGDAEKWDRDGPSQQLDGIRLADDSLVSAMMKTLNQLAELTRLCVNTSVISKTVVIPIIRKFADQLTMMEIDFAVSIISADVFPHLTRLRCGIFDGNVSAAFPKLAELVTCGLKSDGKRPNMRLPSLKKLVIVFCCLLIYDEKLIKEFIQANADNLTILKMRGIPLRLGPAVVFPNLMKVRCSSVYNAGKCPFPALRHLTVAEPVTAELLTSLPADQMLSLNVHSRRERKDVVSAISKMKNLKSLKLSDSASDKADGILSSIFDNMHHLEKVKLVVYGCRKERDEMIATLANQNPKLRDVYFYGINVTDAGLTSLAQLQHLINVSVFAGVKMTTAAVWMSPADARSLHSHTCRW